MERQAEPRGRDKETIVTKSAGKKQRPAGKAVAGIVLLVLGMTLTLVWWVELTVVMKAVIGPALALAGLVALYMTRTS